MPAYAGAYAERWLRDRGVEVLLSTRVTQWPPQVRGPKGRGRERPLELQLNMQLLFFASV
jgi:NADH dehydrogenase FAD-containing subunit